MEKEKYFLVEEVAGEGLVVRQYFRSKEFAINELTKRANANLGKKYHVAKIIATPEIDYNITIKEEE